MTRGRIAFTTSFLALVGTCGLFVSAFTVSMYSDGTTLYAENGPGIIVPLFIPIALAIVAFAGLSAKCTSGSVLGERAAIVALTIFVLYTIAAGFSIGILMLPIAALLAVAVATTPSP
jgi:hypothetical protein